MCSYNAINGVPSCASSWLLDEVARKDWGFDGYITSDCDADADVYYKHHYRNWTQEETVAGVLRAGTDVDCTSFVGKYAPSALKEKLIDERLIDARSAPHPSPRPSPRLPPLAPPEGGLPRCRDRGPLPSSAHRLANLFRVRMRLGHFDPPGPLQRFPLSDVCSPHATSLATSGMVQSAALLKNENKTLPLSPSAAGSLAILGPNANLSKAAAPPRTSARAAPLPHRPPPARTCAVRRPSATTARTSPAALTTGPSPTRLRRVRACSRR